METVTNYWLLWSVYLGASAVFFLAFWRITRFQRRVLLGYLLRAATLAIALTPWYANQEGTVLAPAIIVVLLDAITIGGNAAVRSFVPLFLAVVVALILATAWYFIGFKIFGKKSKKQKVTQ